jgi:Holliday junction resolvase
MPTPTINNEAHVKREVKKLLREWGWWFFMPQAGQFGTSGIPDFMCCKYGRMLTIETKFGYNKPTDLQQARMDEIRRAGGIAIWVNETRLPRLELLLAALDRKFNEAS